MYIQSTLVLVTSYLPCCLPVCPPSSVRLGEAAKPIPAPDSDVCVLLRLSVGEIAPGK